MKCNHCGAENEKGSVFCEECGQKIEIIESPKNLCPHCGAENDEGAVFCDNCGQRMDDVLAAEPVPEPEPEPQKNLCPHCGAENEDGAVFCDNCGHKMTADAPVQTETPRPQPSTYTAPQPQVSRPAAITPEPAAPYSGGTAPVAAANGFFSNKRNVIIVAVAAFVIVAFIITIIVIASNSGSSRSSYSGGGSSYSGGSSSSNGTTPKKTVEKVTNRDYNEGYYTGEWSDGKPNGHGIWKNDEGVSMECDWSDGVATGVIEAYAGNYYCKGYLNLTGHLDGEGYEKTTYDDGTIIINEGTFTDGVLTNGTNTLTKPDGTYYITEGTFVNGDPYNATLSGAEAGGSFEEYGYYKNGKFSTNAGSALWNIGEEIADSYDGGKYSGIVHGIRDLWDAFK